MNEHTILIVEDERALRESISAMLELHGYKVILSENGKEGLEITHKHMPDLIISDIMMPEMDGFEFLHEIRSNPDTELIPIIMLTARADLESKLQGLELGADDYTTKPFEFRVLHLKIINLLQRRQKLLDALKPTLEQDSLESANVVFLKQLDLLLSEQIGDPKLLTGNIALQLNMSHSTFNRRLKKLTGKSPNQYTKEFRLQKARRMILMNYGNVSEIAFKTGFGSLAYFSSQYKTHFGSNPSGDFPSL